MLSSPFSPILSSACVSVHRGQRYVALQNVVAVRRALPNWTDEKTLSQSAPEESVFWPNMEGRHFFRCVRSAHTSCLFDRDTVQPDLPLCEARTRYPTRRRQRRRYDVRPFFLAEIPPLHHRKQQARRNDSVIFAGRVGSSIRKESQARFSRGSLHLSHHHP